MVNQYEESLEKNQEVTFKEQCLSHHPFMKEFDTTKSLDAWYAKFEFIQHLTLFNNVLIVLLGEKGCGKSTFIEQFSNKIDDLIRLSLMHASLANSIDAVIETCIADFNLKPTSSLDQMIAQVNQRKKHCLLILDDAGEIDADVINQLLRVIKSQGIHGYFHVMLASDYSILEYLGSNLEIDNEGLIHTIELAELSANEIKRYIMSCLVEAGYQGEFPLTLPEFDQLVKKCGGNISKVNQYMIDYIKSDSQKVAKTLRFSPNNKGILTRVTKIAASALPLLLVTAIVAYMIPSFQIEKVKTLVKLPAIKKPLSVKEEVKLVNSQLRLDQEDSRPALSQPQEIQLADLTTISEDKLLSKKARDYTTRQFANRHSVVMDKVILVPKTTNEIKRSQISAVNFQPELVSSIAKVPQLNNLTITSVTTPVGESHISKPKIATAKAATKPVITIASKPIKKSNHRAVITKSIAQASLKNNYTIQLIASKDLTAIKRFAKSNGIKKRSNYYKVSRDGKTWFVLGYGNYANKNQARKSLARLPHKLAKNKPWIRDFKHLQRIG